MPRLPTPGSDDGTWGDVLNDFLSQEHNPDGSQKAIPESKVTNLVSDLAGKQATIPSGTYASIKAARPGGRFVALGDSITSAATDNINQTLGESWPLYASVISQQRLHMVRNAGVFGDRTSNMLARFSSDVTPYAPNIVVIMGGTNDYANGVSFSTFRTNITALVAATYAINAIPVLATIPPRDTGGYETTIEQWNMWLRDYAERNGLPAVLDFYRVLTDPTNNHYASAYFSDGVHPNGAGYAAMGEVAAFSLAYLTPDNSPALPVANTNTNNLISDGLFLTDANANGVSDSWTPGSAPTGVVKALVVDSAVLGKMQQVTMTSASGLYVLNQIFSAGYSTSNILRFCGVITSDGGTSVTIQITFTGASLTTRPVYNLSRAISRGVFCQDVVVPTGTTSITFGLQCGGASATGVVSFGQCAVYNLTTLEVLL